LAALQPDATRPPREIMTKTDPDTDLMLSEADRAALGTFRSFHPAASGMHKVNIAIASAFTLLMLAGALWFLFAGLRSPGKGLEYGGLVFGGLALAPAAGLIYLILKLRWRLYLFDNGFVFSKGGNRVVRWDEIQSFYEQQDVVAGIKADQWLRFLLNDGRRLTIDSSYKDFAAFCQTVRERVTATVLARAAEALPKGQSIAFGKLLLSKAGLEKEGDSLAWADVHSIAIEPRIDGRIYTHGVIVYKRNPESNAGKEKMEWYMKLVPRFGNVDAFLQLASQFTNIAGPEAKR
jgi:hypothetical protein